MHARVTTWTLKPGNIEEAIDVTQNLINGGAKDQEGFKGVLLLTNISENKVISITIWETEEAASSGEKGSVYDSQLDRVKRIINGPPSLEIMEIGYSERIGS